MLTASAEDLDEDVVMYELRTIMNISIDSSTKNNPSLSDLQTDGVDVKSVEGDYKRWKENPSWRALSSYEAESVQNHPTPQQKRPFCGRSSWYTRILSLFLFGIISIVCHPFAYSTQQNSMTTTQLTYPNFWI